MLDLTVDRLCVVLGLGVGGRRVEEDRLLHFHRHDSRLGLTTTKLSVWYEHSTKQHQHYGHGMMTTVGLPNYAHIESTKA